MTTRTAPLKPQPKPAKRAVPVKQPGRARRVVNRKALRTGREAAPYAASIIAAAAAAAILRQPDIALLGLGGAGGVAGARLHEASAWHRSGGKAAMRKRRRYQGTASRREIRANLSASAVSRRAAVTCPGLHPSEVPVVIARAKGHDLAASREESYLLVAGPRSGKTGLISCWVADAPGPVLATSTRTDLYAHTILPRLSRGDAWVLSPDADGGIPSTLEWSPVAGCENPAVAIQRAGYLMDAAPRDTSGKDAWWDHKGAELLRLMLHAAALGNATMHEVRAWVLDPASREPAAVLAGELAAPGWDRKLAAMAADESEQLPHIIASAAAALSWMDDPAMARAACPSGEAFDTRRFLAEGTGTVYLVGADRPHGSLAPYFACFAAALFEDAKRLASVSPGGRLPRPLTLALDEAAITCPVPLHKWTAEAGGHGITVMAAVQGVPQLQRWGAQEARTIMKNSTVKVFWGGDTDHEDLEAISAVCGMRDTWDHVRNPDGSKVKTPRQERAIPPERIRMLGPDKVLVLHRNTRPVIGAVTPAWDRPGYERADLGQPFPWRQDRQAALEPPRRQAIPMPPASPAAIPQRPPSPALAGPEGAGAVPSYVPAIHEEEPWHASTATSA